MCKPGSMSLLEVSGQIVRGSSSTRRAIAVFLHVSFLRMLLRYASILHLSHPPSSPPYCRCIQLFRTLIHSAIASVC